MTTAPTMPAFTQDSNAVVIAGAAPCSANIVAQLKDSAAKLYERAKAERQKLVRLAPQYRRDDKYNAEGEYLQNIKLAMGFRRIALQMAQKLESESSPNPTKLRHGANHQKYEIQEEAEIETESAE